MEEDTSQENSPNSRHTTAYTNNPKYQKTSKKSSKNTLEFIIILVIIFAVVLWLTAPSVQMLTPCLDQFNSKMEQNISNARLEKWDHYKTCINGKPVVLELESCYSSVGKKSIMPLSVIIQIAKIIKPGTNVDIAYIIKSTNESCAAYPDTLIR